MRRRSSGHPRSSPRRPAAPSPRLAGLAPACEAVRRLTPAAWPEPGCPSSAGKPPPAHGIPPGLAYYHRAETTCASLTQATTITVKTMLDPRGHGAGHYPPYGGAPPPPSGPRYGRATRPHPPTPHPPPPPPPRPSRSLPHPP